MQRNETNLKAVPLDEWSDEEISSNGHLFRTLFWDYARSNADVVPDWNERESLKRGSLLVSQGGVA